MTRAVALGCVSVVGFLTPCGDFASELIDLRRQPAVADLPDALRQNHSAISAEQREVNRCRQHLFGKRQSAPRTSSRRCADCRRGQHHLRYRPRRPARSDGNRGDVVDRRAPSLLCCLNRSLQLETAVKDTGRFAVNMLRADHHELPACGGGCAPGPSRAWLIAKPSPSPLTRSITGTRTLSNSISTWPSRS